MGTYEYRKDTRTWFQSDRKDIGSFLWICEVLDLDPQFALARVDDGDDIALARMNAFRYQGTAIKAAL